MYEWINTKIEWGHKQAILIFSVDSDGRDMLNCLFYKMGIVLHNALEI